MSIADWNVETIFPFKEKLFIGSQSGMFVYNITDADHPKLEGSFGHVQSCDPVIADDDHAYVTLRSGSTCQGFTNELEILSLGNFTNPQLIAKYDMTNPHGLSKDGDLLFICDGVDGIKVYDAHQPKDIKLLSHVNGIQTFDVIAMNKLALVVTNNALLQYDYSNPSALKLLSKVEFKD